MSFRKRQAESRTEPWSANAISRNADCESYFGPQEKFEAIVAQAWRKHGPRLVDVSYANAYGGPDARVLEAMHRALDEQKDLSFQYTPYGGKTPIRRQIASQLSRRFELSMNFKDVVMTPGAMSALNVVFRTLFGSERELIVLTPCWLDYPLYLANLGVPFRMVPLGPDKRLDLDAIEQAITPQTGGLIFTHPGCPTGVMLKQDELSDLAALLARKESEFGTSLYVISDEVHRDVLWSDAEFSSALSFHPRTIAIYSFGKSLFIQGQRIGYAAVSPKMPEREAVRSELERAVRMMGFCTPTNLMQRAIVDLLDYRPDMGVVAERQELAREALTKYGYRVWDAEATFFVYAQSPDPDDFAFTERLADRGVLVLPSSMFHEKGCFRISLTAKTDVIRAGLPAFETVMDSFRA